MEMNFSREKRQRKERSSALTAAREAHSPGISTKNKSFSGEGDSPWDLPRDGLPNFLITRGTMGDYAIKHLYPFRYVCVCSCHFVKTHQVSGALVLFLANKHCVNLDIPVYPEVFSSCFNNQNYSSNL